MHKAKKLAEILDNNFSLSSSEKISSPSLPIQTFSETVYLNLLELFFPDILYVAELTLDEPNSHNFGKKKSRFVSKREKVRRALSDIGLKFAVDWECYENSLITFHDLSDSALPLANIIDLGTVTTLEPDEFYGFDENQERVFTGLCPFLVFSEDPTTSIGDL